LKALLKSFRYVRQGYDKSLLFAQFTEMQQKIVQHNASGADTDEGVAKAYRTGAQAPPPGRRPAV